MVLGRDISENLLTNIWGKHLVYWCGYRMGMLNANEYGCSSDN